MVLQSQSQIENEIKAFAYNWYARFDREVSVKELAKNLPENEIQFVYPQTTVTRTDDFLKQVKASRKTVEYSAHNVGDIFVYPIVHEIVYTVLTPHTYYTACKDGNFAEIDIASRLSIELNKANSKDKKGLEQKITSYAVTFQNYATQDISESDLQAFYLLRQPTLLIPFFVNIARHPINIHRPTFLGVGDVFEGKQYICCRITECFAFFRNLEKT